jgi:hypothetical protein
MVRRMLFGSLSEGPVVHADGKRVGGKGPNGGGYVWAFASPDTAVYVHAPTRMDQSRATPVLLAVMLAAEKAKLSREIPSRLFLVVSAEMLALLPFPVVLQGVILTEILAVGKPENGSVIRFLGCLSQNLEKRPRPA